MASSYYNYEYFCGANITIALNEQPLLECAGISYSVIDSQSPIYGYSSRLYDAVAPGQKIVQGSFVVNFTDPSYVHDVVTTGFNRRAAYLREQQNVLYGLESAQDRNNEANSVDLAQVKDLLVRRDIRALNEVLQNSDIEESLYSELESSIERLQSYNLPAEVLGSQAGNTDPTMSGPFDIYVYFGDPMLSRKYIFYGCFIVGHGSTIQIDENVILEEYNFFARDVVPWNLSKDIG